MLGSRHGRWPRARSIHVDINYINYTFCYPFSLRSSKLKQEVSKMQSSMLADLLFQENKNLSGAGEVVPFVWDKPLASSIVCKRFPVCENEKQCLIRSLQQNESQRRKQVKDSSRFDRN